MPVQIGQQAGHGFMEPFGLLSDCHRRIERFLAMQARIAREYEGGALEDDRRTALMTALRYFREAAPKHTADEEESVFPRLRTAGAEADLGELARLEADHDTADALHAEADALCQRWLGQRVLEGESVARLRAIFGELTALYTAHIEIEDRRLFPLAQRLLCAADQKAIGEEMAARRSVR
jgi:hemerythrin-like domain-containing protein